MKVHRLDPDRDTTPAHWLDASTPISKLAKLCKMSVKQVRAFLPMKIPLSDIRTFDEAEIARHFGCITEPEWREFCYKFRDDGFKMSDLGKEDAVRHAQDNDLPPPFSDRARKFTTSDGYVLHHIREIGWVDNEDEELRDLGFAGDMRTGPLDHLAEPVEGTWEWIDA